MSEDSSRRAGGPSAAAGSSAATAFDRRVLLILVLAAVLPYASTLASGFVYDDIPQILENPYVQSLQHLREILTTTVWSFQGEQGVSNYYRPLMMLSYLVCYQIFGPLPYGFHLVNVLLHACVVLLLYRLTLRVFGDSRIAFVTALLFAIHPIHTEVVAWVAALPDLQVTALVLVTFLLLLREPHSGHAAWLRAAALAAFALALLAKEPAMVLPALVVVYEHFVRPDRAQTTWQQKSATYAGLWILLFGYVAMRVALFKGFAPVLQRANLSWPEAFSTAFALVGQYVGKLFWPAQLSAFYPFQKSSSLFDARVLAGLGVCLVSLGLFVWLWKRARPAAFALLWLYAMLLPVLNARWMAASVFNERYLYLPSIGFCWLIAWAGVSLWERASENRRWLRPALAGALIVAAFLGASRIVVRNLDWQNEYVFCVRTLAAHPDAHLIRANLGKVYWERRDFAAAEREWKIVLEHVPTNLVTLNNLGLLSIQQRKYSEGVALLNRAVELRPAYATAQINLGKAYEGMGQNDKALAAYEQAVALAPLNPVARNHLGSFLLRAGKTQEAREQFEKSLAARPTPEAAEGLGEILFRQGNRAEAERALRQAVELDPLNLEALLLLAEMYADSGRTAEAIRTYRDVLQDDPRNQRAHKALERLRAIPPPK